VDLGDCVLERLTLDIFLDRPVIDLPLQERLCEVGEFATDVNAVPFGASFVLAQGALPALAADNV
jgi:hypothetical protein